jgi:hypothetical protein
MEDKAIVLLLGVYVELYGDHGMLEVYVVLCM